MPDLATFQLAFGAAMAGTGRRGSLESQAGFAVYRNTTPVALIDVLRGQYPVTAEILGEEGFAHSAYLYSRANPPADAILVAYGADFADFLAEQEFAAELPYLADVAAIERMRSEAQDEADAAPMDLRDLAAIGGEDWAATRLPLHPAVRFGWLKTPARTIWQAHVTGFDTLEPDWIAEGVLITRPAGRVLVHEIGPAEHRMLSGLRLRETAGEAAAATAKLYPTADISGLFARLVTLGAFARPPHLERN